MRPSWRSTPASSAGCWLRSSRSGQTGRSTGGGLLPREVRRAFRDELGVDDATWRRGRGWALAVGLIGIPYYEDTNPHFAAMGRYLVDEVLRDE